MLVMVGVSRLSTSSAQTIPGLALLARDCAETNLRLLQLNLGASLLELSLDLLGFVLVDAFLDRLGCALDQILGLLEAKAGDGADFLDDFDLLFAGGGEHDREFGLFLNRSGGCAARSGTSPPNPGSGPPAPPFFKPVCQ